IGEGGSRKRSSTPDVLRTRSRLSSDALKSEAGDDSSPSETASLTVPDQGPLSVVDATDISADDIPDLLPPLRSVEESLDRVTELPPGGRQVLQHLAKGRPRRAKTRAPTRSMLRAPCTPNSENPEGEGDEDSDTLAAGLESFFGEDSDSPTSTLLGAVRLRTTGLLNNNGSSNGAEPVRPPSGSDGSSTNTSAANTPDSGDALDESTDSGVASSQDSAERKHHPKGLID
ncbi:hypothetical protein B566_EDAN014290, partial [Ephemera danica]